METLNFLHYLIFFCLISILAILSYLLFNSLKNYLHKRKMISYIKEQNLVEKNNHYRNLEQNIKSELKSFYIENLQVFVCTQNEYNFQLTKNQIIRKFYGY